MRGHGSGSIRQRKNGTWEVRYTVGVKADGTANRKSKYFGTRKEAREFLTKASAELALGTYREASDMRLREWAKICVEVYGANLSPETVRGYQSVIKTHIDKDDIGGMELRKISQYNLQQWINEKSKDRSPKTVRNINAVASWLFSCAVRSNKLSVNPCVGIVLPAKSAPVRRILTEERCQHILANAHGHKDFALWVILATTGMRLSEALGLAWDTVDMKTGRYEIKQTVVVSDHNAVIRDGTKTPSSMRVGIIPREVIPALAERKLAQQTDRLIAGELWEENGLIFTDQLGNPRHRNTVDNSFRKFQMDLGVPREECVGFHSFRHLLATTLLREGAPDKAIAAQFGHTNVNYTRHQYADKYDSDRDLIADIAVKMAGVK